ncbi:MAG: GNAT family N-acetyltransferase [Lautropia sp.]
MQALQRPSRATSDARPRQRARFEGPRIHVPGIGRLIVRELGEEDDPAFQMLLTAPQAPASGRPILQTGRMGLDGGTGHHAVIGVFAPINGVGERLLGVAGVQVSGTPDEIGSFGVLVDAPLRGLGLGQLLLVEMLKLAEAEQLPIVFARIEANNRPMLALASNLGFNVQRVPGDRPLLVSWTLAGARRVARMAARRDAPADVDATPTATPRG